MIPVLAIISAASALTGAIGAKQEGDAAAKAARYNAQIGQMQAQQALNQASSDMAQQKVAARKNIGAQHAAYAASGIQNEGSALDVLQESASNAEKDSLNIKHQGDLKAWSFQAGANLDLMKASSSETAGNMGAASHLLAGAGKTYEKYYGK